MWLTHQTAVGNAPAVMLRQDGSSAGYLLGWVRCHGMGNKYSTVLMEMPRSSNGISTMKGRLELDEVDSLSDWCKARWINFSTCS